MVNMQVASATYFKFIIMDILSGMSNLFQSGYNAATSERNRRDQLKENQKNRDFQSVEAEKQRMYNSSEAAIARNFSAEQADKAYQRSTLGSQISQMKAAGLNPAMMYSQGQFAPAAAAPTSQASSSASPSGSGGFSPIAAPDINVARQLAEIDNIKANTRKTEAEGDIAISDAKVRDMFNGLTLQSLHMDVTYKGTLDKLGNKQIELFTKQIQDFDERWNEIRERVQLMKMQKESTRWDIQMKKIEARFKTPYMQAVIDKIQSDSGVSKFQVFRGMKLLSAELLNVQADTANKNADTELKGSQTYKTNAEIGYINLGKAQLRLQNEKLDLSLGPLRSYSSRIDPSKWYAPFLNGLADGMQYLMYDSGMSNFHP